MWVSNLMHELKKNSIFKKSYLNLVHNLNNSTMFQQNWYIIEKFVWEESATINWCMWCPRKLSSVGINNVSYL